MARTFLEYQAGSGSQEAADLFRYETEEIGDEAADRLIVLCGHIIYEGETVDANLIEVQIGGVVASLMVGSYTLSAALAGQVAPFIAVAFVPTGELANFDFYYDADATTTNRIFAWWSVTGESTGSTAHDVDLVIDTGGDGDITASIDVAAGGTGFAITVGEGYISGAVTTTWTGLTEDYDVPDSGIIVISAASEEYALAQVGLAVRSNDDNVGSGAFGFKIVSTGSIAPAAGGGNVDAVMNGAGAATAIGVGSALTGAAMNATGVATAIAVGSTAFDAVMNATGAATAIAVGNSITVADAAMNAAGVATAIAVGDSLAGAAMNAAGLATAIAEGASEAGAVMNAAGLATAAAVGQDGILLDAAMNASGSSTAIFEGASLAGAEMSASGAATAVAIAADGGLDLPAVAAPAGGGGATWIPGASPRVKIRKPKTHLIRYGEWPEAPDPKEIKRREEREYFDLINGIKEEYSETSEEDDNDALMLILSLAA